MAAVWTAATAAITTLRSIGLPDVCFVGGVACAQYGNSRTPGDLDILVLNTARSQERIKADLVAANSSFYLVASKNPYATYKVLWYRHPSYATTKVDILLPGIMDIPSVQVTDIVTRRSLPAAPFAVVLLLKLQAWSQHRASLKSYYRIRHYTDHDDLERMVPLAAAAGVSKEEGSSPTSFVLAAQSRVTEYLTAYPDSVTREGWKTIGFTVPAPPRPPPKVRSPATPRRYTYQRYSRN